VDRVSSTGKVRNNYIISVEKPERKHHLGTTIMIIRNINGIGRENVADSSVSEQGPVAGFN
jgi:hypothetical protein